MRRRGIGIRIFGVLLIAAIVVIGLRVFQVSSGTSPNMSAVEVSKLLKGPSTSESGREHSVASHSDMIAQDLSVMMHAVDPANPTRDVRSVVYVCDRSGSMMSKMTLVKNALKHSIDQLRPDQAFGIIFFSDDEPLAMLHHLVLASAENKILAHLFLRDISPAGRTNPLSALEHAFRQQPELIFLLTDGDFEDGIAVMKRVRELNEDQSVKINSIALIGEDDTYATSMYDLTTIARESGGKFAIIRMGNVRR